MNDITVVGLSHKTAPVETRERFRVDSLETALSELSPLADEVAVLTTCNRVEIYLHRAADPDSVLHWLAGCAEMELNEVRELCYVRSGANACKHLFFVASSLDSLVVGETQIRGQVKEAYRVAQSVGSLGPILHTLFRSALRVSKEIADQTGVGRGNVSVAGAAADLAARVFQHLESAQVLVLGAGETAELVVANLGDRGVSSFHVLNRDAERAAVLAGRCGGTSGSLDDMVQYLPAADVVICAAPGDPFLVEAKAMRRALRRRRGHPMVVIDIAVPRGVDARVDQLDNVYRYDMDALTAVTQDALRHRRSDFIQCCTMIDAATLNLVAETRAHKVGGAIAELESLYESVAMEELDALQKKLPEDAHDSVRKSIRRLVRRLLHLPKQALRDSDADESEVIRRAFTGKRDEP